MNIFSNEFLLLSLLKNKLKTYFTIKSIQYQEIVEQYRDEAIKIY